MPLTFLQFSREYEAEADYLGIQYAYRAGYDPQGMVSIFEKLDSLEKHKPGALSRGVQRSSCDARPHCEHRDRDCDDSAGAG